MSEAEEVLCRVEGKVGRITLNRPQAIHALNTNMIRLITAALLAWRDDPAVELVMFDHAGERGFCAGGDIRMLAESGAGDGREAREFFFEEYRLNDLIFRYAKPRIAFMDGITMGGGVGLSRPCRFRVATERTTFAMPESGIGLFPDVGGGWYLSRMPDHLGLWLALTGARIKAADCELLQIATDYVESARLPELKAAILAAPDRTEALLTEFEGDAGRPTLAQHQDEIARLFAGQTLEAIMAALKAAGTDWAAEQLKVLATKSPTTMKVSLRQLSLGARCATFAENMAIEYRIGARIVQSHDFIEGVRAVIVEKDNAPQWNPATPEGVTQAQLESIFAPLPSDEEWSPLR
jgi:enoyl-CoA hydratase